MHTNASPTGPTSRSSNAVYTFTFLYTAFRITLYTFKLSGLVLSVVIHTYSSGDSFAYITDTRSMNIVDADFLEM